MFWIEYLEERGKFHLVSYFVVSFFLNVVRLYFYGSLDGNADNILFWVFGILLSFAGLFVQPYFDIFIFSTNVYGHEIPFQEPLSAGTDLAFVFVAACVFQILVILWHVSRCMSYLADDL